MDETKSNDTADNYSVVVEVTWVKFLKLDLNLVRSVYMLFTSVHLLAFIRPKRRDKIYPVCRK